tara:strand:- start:252 stop:467 length:216 start_codon:yes stop_codon:yes gene_type:complete
MDKRKLQAVINRINDNVTQYKKEIRYFKKNEKDFSNLDVFERITHLEGRLNEAYYVLRQLEYLKESIKGGK